MVSHLGCALKDDSAKPLVTQSQVTKREERTAFSFGFKDEDVKEKEATSGAGSGFSFGFGTGEEELFGEGEGLEREPAPTTGGFTFGFGNGNDADEVEEEQEKEGKKGVGGSTRASPRSGHFGRRFDDESDDDTALDTARLAQLKRPAAGDDDGESSDDDFTRKGDGTRDSAGAEVQSSTQLAIHRAN